MSAVLKQNEILFILLGLTKGREVLTYCQDVMEVLVYSLDDVSVHEMLRIAVISLVNHIERRQDAGYKELLATRAVNLQIVDIHCEVW